MSTLVADVDDAWNAAVRTVRPRGRPGGPADLWHLWKASRGHRVLILQGSVAAGVLYRDLVLAVAIALFRRPRPAILMTDATWEVGSATWRRRAPWAARLVPFLVRRVIALLDGDHVTYGVLSTEELSSFPQVWRIPRDRVRLTLFPHTLYGERLDTPTSDEGYLFAGGNSLRDYDLLEQAVADLPYEVRVASSWTPREPRAHLRAETVPPERFLDLMAGCRACVVPLAESVRSAGQQTYLNAMALGKPVIVTDSAGVHDLVDDGVTGTVVARDAAALRSAIDAAMRPDRDPEVAEMAARARTVVRREHTEFTYRRRLLEIVGLAPPAP